MGKIKVFLFDFSRVLLFPKNNDYEGELNALHKNFSKSKDYRFSEYFKFNDGLISYIKSHKLDKIYKIYIFTSGTIQNAPECQKKIKGIFETVFSAEELGLNKRQPKSYQILAEKIDSEPEEILFIDDNKKNVQAARLAGLQGLVYSNNSQLISFIETELKP